MVGNCAKYVKSIDELNVYEMFRQRSQRQQKLSDRIKYLNNMEENYKLINEMFYISTTTSKTSQLSLSDGNSNNGMNNENDENSDHYDDYKFNNDHDYYLQTTKNDNHKYEQLNKREHDLNNDYNNDSNNQYDRLDTFEQQQDQRNYNDVIDFDRFNEKQLHGSSKNNKQSLMIFSDKKNDNYQNNNHNNLNQLDKNEQDYYKDYDPMVGYRIAISLGLLILIFIIFILYKTHCQSKKNRRLLMNVQQNIQMTNLRQSKLTNKL